MRAGVLEAGNDCALTRQDHVFAADYLDKNAALRNFVEPADEMPAIDRAEREGAKTHDPIWNAAQRQLLGEGRMHNYLRMLWGKKVLEWSKTPQEAIETLIELNNRYALDGRNPNSYSGIFWVFGRYDRAWGPEREIFGTVRYMSSDSTKKKLHLSEYLARWGALPKGGAR